MSMVLKFGFDAWDREVVSLWIVVFERKKKVEKISRESSIYIPPKIITRLWLPPWSNQISFLPSFVITHTLDPNVVIG